MDRPDRNGRVKAKTYTGTIVSDVSGAKSSDRGYVVVMMENGDKAFVRIDRSTSAMSKDGKPESGQGAWTYIGGKGTFRGLKGKGTYKSKAAAERLGRGSNRRRVHAAGREGVGD